MRGMGKGGGLDKDEDENGVGEYRDGDEGGCVGMR